MIRKEAVYARNSRADS
ncbi:Protein of unknown function [Lactobacillus delbrueckii subsp. lactis]|nr:Putative uncharacterized protein [Lactobacillus delbrueckii subsp. lactis]CDR82725.1 Protein of unknown function [Lactobacillus delbrueckii subsp. lactis]